ncbi:tautomerase family protein [Ensifer sp. SSB1]|uniref:tautomerase family protein n=1 Tax=Ensifer sp. SSB1 TaxID=2795385 RepID=UPI001A4AFAD9|nr:tautomerase family protein [Ensifer sp. SSB1]MBK5570722.1 tautomerase family protein [Ensifer sp. SSB1]
MPFVRITIVRETLADDPSGKKAVVSRKVAAAIAEATGLPEREVSVVFDEVEARNWYIGSTDVETLGRRSA